MKKWIYSAIFYLAVVIGGYYIYEAILAEKTDHSDRHNNSVEITGQESSTEGDQDHSHGGNGTHNNEVIVNVTAETDQLVLTLQDSKGMAVTDLEINHEKLVHLIVVDEHLEQYYHLHPEEIAPGKYMVPFEGANGSYKAFVDIKPTHLDYVVEPKPFIIGDGESKEHAHNTLTVDSNLIQNVDGHQVKLLPSKLDSNEDVTLTFEIENAQLEPYLGALGHVVILDEHAEQYLHVHPVNHNQPIFETQFTSPGVYKIWAEFKQNGKVSIFPFVVEVK